ncbi:hypothetical protein BATDEDRAFT_88507 [Batrachochytrium dendrobatidis JAM81]|uniref:C2H2-type domain-containing protein n=1 Tax=Batrachochytrium dendrobatidis (strain JAM81 / FGSC 10211) TaxID=684364 RepID=F4P2V3_BATDJ|nr:uncharacterized protein BATDEDRAFT_88507 [Batrachochytrium dendrobatidis JAM81]EGF80086.1 hypothetical protein BATDEDRAFT_88507 [Batrachochytrium dendrobatidis JAM81]|eukprot:XP_006679165.1 hypothetical protein BATDEDRAFT_88507 [Batrachochytrium dendrobatidis JAM81]
MLNPLADLSFQDSNISSSASFTPTTIGSTVDHDGAHQTAFAAAEDSLNRLMHHPLNVNLTLSPSKIYGQQDIDSKHIADHQSPYIKLEDFIHNQQQCKNSSMDYSTCSQLNDAEQFCSSNTAVHQQFAQPLSEQQFIPYIASVELPSADTTALADGCHQLVHSQAILTSINLNGHAGIDHNGHLQAHSPDITMLTSPTTGITHLSHAAGLSGGIHNGIATVSVMGQGIGAFSDSPHPNLLADTGNANCMLMVDPISPVHAGMTSETMTQMLPAIVVTTGSVPFQQKMMTQARFGLKSSMPHTHHKLHLQPIQTSFLSLSDQQQQQFSPISPRSTHVSPLSAQYSAISDVPYDRAMQFMYGGPAESPIAPVQMTWDMSSSLFPSYSNMNSSVVGTQRDFGNLRTTPTPSITSTKMMFPQRTLLLPQPLQQIQTGIGHNPLSFQQSDEQGLLARARFPELYQHIPFQHYDSFNHQRSFSMPHTVAASDLLMDPNSFTFPSGSHESQSHIAPFFQQLPLLPQQSNQSQHSSLSMTSSEDTLDHRLYHTPWLLNPQHVPPITVDPNYIGTNHSNYLASATLPSSVSSFSAPAFIEASLFPADSCSYVDSTSAQTPVLTPPDVWSGPSHLSSTRLSPPVKKYTRSAGKRLPRIRTMSAKRATKLLSPLCSVSPVSKISRTHSSPPLPQKETISASRPESIFSDSDSDSCFNVDNDPISVATAAAAQLQIKSTASLERPATKSKKFTYSEMTPCANILCQETFKSQHLLQAHVRRFHAEDRPYVCSICSTSFHRKHDLSRHARSIHGKGKQFHCEPCQRSYARSDALKRHILSAAHRNFLRSISTGDGASEDAIHRISSNVGVGIKNKNAYSKHSES